MAGKRDRKGHKNFCWIKSKRLCWVNGAFNVSPTLSIGSSDHLSSLLSFRVSFCGSSVLVVSLPLSLPLWVSFSKHQSTAVSSTFLQCRAQDLLAFEFLESSLKLSRRLRLINLSTVKTMKNFVSTLVFFSLISMMTCSSSSDWWWVFHFLRIEQVVQQLALLCLK